MGVNQSKAVQPPPDFLGRTDDPNRVPNEKGYHTPDCSATSRIFRFHHHPDPNHKLCASCIPQTFWSASQCQRWLVLALQVMFGNARKCVWKAIYDGERGGVMRGAGSCHSLGVGCALAKAAAFQGCGFNLYLFQQDDWEEMLGDLHGTAIYQWLKGFKLEWREIKYQQDGTPIFPPPSGDFHPDDQMESETEEEELEEED